MTGTTDANAGFTPGAHSTHDIGMAMDLSLQHYVNSTFQSKDDVKSISAEIAVADKKYTDQLTKRQNRYYSDPVLSLPLLIEM